MVSQAIAEQIRQTNSPVVSATISSITGRPIFITYAPVRDADGRLIGLVAIAFESERLASILSGVGDVPNRKIYLVDDVGHAIAHPDQSLVASFADLSSMPAVAGLLASRTEHGVVSSSGRSGEQLAAYARVPDLGWSVVVERPASDALAVVREGRNATFGLLLGAIVLAVVAGSLLARALARPLTALSWATGRLARGDSAVALPRSGTSEIHDLVTTFGEMRERLVAHAAERERLIGDLQWRAAQLDVSNKELHLANREVEAFAYSVAHDLRSPVRHMDGFSRVLASDYADCLDERGKKYLGFMREGSVRIGQLIDSLLALTDVARREVQRADVDLSELAQLVAAEVQSEQPDRQVEFVVAPGLVANGDRDMLRAVLQNLLGNAWKFTSKREHARIESGAVVQEGRPAYYVRDDGAGFDLAYADKPLVPFSVCTARTSSPAAASVWPRWRGSSACTVGGSGPKGQSIRERRSTLCWDRRSTWAHHFAY